MKNINIILLSAILVPLFSACEKEPDKNLDNGTYKFSMSVLNDDYTEVIPIKGVKRASSNDKVSKE